MAQSPLSALSETSTEFSGNYAISNLEKLSFGGVGSGSETTTVEKLKPIDVDLKASRSWDSDLEKAESNASLPVRTAEDES